MSKIRDFRDLVVWQKAIDLGVESCRLAIRLPPTLQFSLGLQLCKSSTSVPSNIAEGHEQSTAGYQHHIRIALGSLAELYTQLVVCVRLDVVTKDEWSAMEDELIEVQRMLRALHAALRRRRPLPPPPPLD